MGKETGLDVDQDQVQDQDSIPIKRDATNIAFYKILETRISRRGLLKNISAISAGLTLNAASRLHAQSNSGFALAFEEIAQGLDESLYLASGYTYQVLLRWGDPVFANAPVFDPYKQTPAAQAKQFGYNNDFITFLSLDQARNDSMHGLLVVNHEFVNSRMMHPGSPHAFKLTKQQVDTEILAHGLTIVEVQKKKYKWHVNLESKYNRRITPHTIMRFSGPACGHDRLKTSFSPNGDNCMGTFGNCAGSMTPWGTVLTAEENVQAYFIGQAKKTFEKKSYKRLGLKGDRSAYSAWGKHYEQWDLDRQPQAGLHAGWIVEIDPYDPNFIPIKRTALGRCKHEGCGVHVNKDSRVVIYMGDDQVFEYIYRYISKNKFEPGNRNQNLSLLDDGELSVAEFTDQGTVIWHPLLWGMDPHTRKNGFNSQADVVIDMRSAADLVGATPMDRPEEIKVNPVTGNVFVVLTNNFKRSPLNTDVANPRALNRHGHILELVPPQLDHRAHEFKWDVFVLAGNPNNKFDHAKYHADISENGWFSNPDNCSFDKFGNIWIATDGFYRQGIADGIWVSAAQGEGKALTKHFLRAPREAEICSPCFTPDQKTMFCSVQHPGGDSSFDRPSTRWPDFDPQLPPRPAVIAITHEQDKNIGG